MMENYFLMVSSKITSPNNEGLYSMFNMIFIPLKPCRTDFSLMNSNCKAIYISKS